MRLRHLRHLRQLAERSLVEFFDDRCPQLAAAISYYALFAVFPLVILGVTAFGAIIGPDAARSDIIEIVSNAVPLATNGRATVADQLGAVTGHAGVFGIVGVAGLIFSASGIMGAIRNGINTAWDLEDRRPPLQGKLIDILLVVGVGVGLGLSLALTLAQHIAPSVGAAGAAASAGFFLAATAAVFVVSLLLFRFIPATPVRSADAWPGALAAALGYQAVKEGFSLYLDNFADYGAVYGSLAAIVVFLLFVFLSANVFLLGAEVASEVPRVRSGRYDAEESSGAEESLGQQLRDALRRLVLGDPEPPDEERPEDRRRSGEM